MESHSSHLVCNQLNKCKAVLSSWATQTQGLGAYDPGGLWKHRARAGKTSRCHPSRIHFQDLPVFFSEWNCGTNFLVISRVHISSVSSSRFSSVSIVTRVVYVLGKMYSLLV